MERSSAIAPAAAVGPPAAPRYETDVAAWAAAQATAIRERRWDAVDVANVAEEIESVGVSQRHELRSRLLVLLMHLLRQRHQPERATSSWRETIDVQRDGIDAVLADSPSLVPIVPAVIAAVYPRARRSAARETGKPLTEFPAECPFTLPEILEDGEGDAS